MIFNTPGHCKTILLILLAILYSSVPVLAQTQDNYNISVVRDWNYSKISVLEVRNNIVFYEQRNLLIIKDYTDPKNPVELSSTEIGAAAYDIILEGDRLFVSTDYDIIHLYNISDYSDPIKISEFPDIRSPVYLDVEDNLLYTSSETEISAHVFVVDYTDPANPLKLGHYENYHRLYDLTVREGIAYITAKDIGLQIVDMTDPINPIEISNFPVSYQAISSYIGEDVAYISDRSIGLHVVDLQDIKNPKLIKIIDSIKIAYEIKATSNKMYFHTYNNIDIYSIADKYNPVLINQISTKNLLRIKYLVNINCENNQFPNI